MNTTPEMYGQCPHCRGSLTAGHTCPGQQAAHAILNGMATQPMKLAVMIRLWMAARNVEQAELANTLGTTPSTVSRFMNGHGVPDGITMARLIAWLLQP